MPRTLPGAGYNAEEPQWVSPGGETASGGGG